MIDLGVFRMGEASKWELPDAPGSPADTCLRHANERLLISKAGWRATR